MKRPPIKKMVTSRVASICVRKSCERERISRNVQTMRLIQKITVKATTKPMTMPSTLFKVSSRLLELDVVGEVTTVAVGVAVGDAANSDNGGVLVRTCTKSAITGLPSLSE